jgi:hypothetical protein
VTDLLADQQRETLAHILFSSMDEISDHTAAILTSFFPHAYFTRSSFAFGLAPL